MWKLFHHQFCWIYLTVGVPIRLFVARRLKNVSLGKAGFYAIASSLVASLLSTWFPILPLVGGAILFSVAGHAAESTLISVPIIAVFMGIETAVADAVFLRRLLKGAVHVRFGALLIANMLNGAIALALGLVWAFGHMPIFIATLDNYR